MLVCIVPILRNIVGVKAPPVQAHLPHGLLCPCLPLTLLSFLATWTFWNVGDQTPKIEIIPKLWGFFGDQTPKIPKIEIIPASIPNIYIIPVPKISPKCFWGFSGKKPQKSPKLNLSPSPKNPQNWSKGLPHPRPVPEIRGRDGENRGSGPRFTTLLLLKYMIYQ